MKVLFVTPWYPSVKDTMSGLFVEKILLEAKRRGIDCRVISSVNFFSFLKEFRMVMKSWEKPDLIHLHVTTKQGILPLLMKKFYGVPYIVTEHWSGYLDENGDYLGLCNRFVIGKIYRWLTRKIISEASIVTAVSELLRRSMRKCGLDNADFRVIHNVVDDVFDNVPDNTDENEMSFLHVSCFSDRAKNVTGIIEAARILRDKGVNFRLTMVGDGPDFDKNKRLAVSYGLNDYVRFAGVLQSAEVANEMSRHKCLILFSNFETAAVVLQEAMSVGMKIISTPVGIAGEYEGRIKTVKPGDCLGLAEAMENVEKIRCKQKISFSNVGDEYFAVYNEIIQRACR